MAFEWFGTLVAEFGKEVAMTVAVVYGGYKFHRLKSILGAAVSSIGFAATVGAIVLGAVVLASTLGWVALDPAKMFSDLTGGAGALWNLLVKPAVDMLLGGQ